MSLETKEKCEGQECEVAPSETPLAIPAASVLPLAAPSWRKYVHVCLPVISLAAFIIISRQYLLETLTRPVDILLLVPVLAIVNFFLASAVYPSPPPASTSSDEIPWSRKKVVYRLMANVTYNFVTRNPMGWVGLAVDSSLSSVAALVLGGYSASKDDSPTPKSEFFAAVKYLLAATALYFITPSPLTPLLSHFLRVYARATFISLLDVVIAFLTHPPLATTRGTLLTLLVHIFLFALLAISATLNSNLNLLPLHDCRPKERALLATYLCHASIHLSDPHILQKSALCAVWRGRGASFSLPGAAHALAENAEDIAKRCWASLGAEALRTCLVINGLGWLDRQDLGYEVLGYCPAGDKMAEVARLCIERFKAIESGGPRLGLEGVVGKGLGRERGGWF